MNNDLIMNNFAYMPHPYQILSKHKQFLSMALVRLIGLALCLCFAPLAATINSLMENDCEVGNCTLLTQLECALYTTDENERKLNQAFLPPKASTQYIHVFYDFKENPEEDDFYFTIDKNCNVSYIWAIGGFLLIQPPAIFQWTSMLFSYSSNDVDKLHLTLPIKCATLVKYDTNSPCECLGKDSYNLNILTQQVHL